MKRGANPCYGCVEPKRYIGCHADCKKYKKFRKELDEENKKIREEKSKGEEYGEFRKAAHDRLKHWDRKGTH